MANGDQTNLATNQQPIGQPAQTTQPAQQPMSMHQMLGSRTTDQALKLKSLITKQKQQKEIVRNVGAERATNLVNEYKKNGLSISSALEQSKKELSVNSKELDNLYFKENTTSQSFLALRNRKGQTYTKNERNLWFTHYNSILGKENDALNQRGAISQKDFDRSKISSAAQNDYRVLQDMMDRGISEMFIPDKVTGLPTTTFKQKKDKDGKPREINELDQKKYNALQEARRSIYESSFADVSGNLSDQLEMQKNLAIIANNVDINFLRDKGGIFIGEEFIEIPAGVTSSPSGLRNFYYNSLRSQLLRARNHSAKLGVYNAPEEEKESTDYSQYEISTDSK